MQLLIQGLKKSEGSSDKMQHMLKMKEQAMQRLQLQVQNFQEEAKKQHQLIQKLEVEREGYSKEAMETKHRCIEQVRHSHITGTGHVLINPCTY